MQYIVLTKGQVAIVDDKDYQLVMSYPLWYAHPIVGYDMYYAVTKVKGNDGKWHALRMHRLIMNTPEGMHTDHINKDTLDNRRENLRICTPSQNLFNRTANANNMSGFKGVSFDKQNQKFRATIQANGKWKHLGRYATAREASIAYQEAALRLHGEFARF